MIDQKKFVLTEDMVPIFVSDIANMHGCNFICPLPKGSKELLEKTNMETIEKTANKIKDRINKIASEQKHPFENILLGYHSRTEEEQRELLKGLKIHQVVVDHRGVYGVWAGGNVNSGDIYLASNPHRCCDFHISGIEGQGIFESNMAFCCHNIDFYWQALLTRAFVIAYFNLLNAVITDKKNNL